MNHRTFILCATAIFMVAFLGGFFVVKKSVMELSDENEMTQEIKDLPPPEVKPQEVVKKETVSKVPVPYKCPSPSKEYTDETYLDVGQEVSLSDKTYTPTTLTPIDRVLSKYDRLCIKEEVSKALARMLEAAQKEGHKIIVSSGFRDYNTQASIMTINIKNGNVNASKLIAKPGYSEHQLGVAVDLTSATIANASATQRFGSTPESAWLEIHAHEYGFMESYPKGKEDITGYLYEPWHYRYVGIDAAREIVQSGETVNQYFKRKKEENVAVK